MARWLDGWMVKKRIMIKKYLKLEDMVAYKKATELADKVYTVVSRWSWFDKRTLGSQWVDSTDSIAGNLAEGFGRFHKKDKEKFYYNARGSSNILLFYLHYGSRLLDVSFLCHRWK